MRKWITLLMTLLVGCGSYANANTGQLTLEAGYRQDNIDWKHRFPSNDPFVSSGTKFKDLDIFQLGIHGRTTVGCNFYVRGSAYWGWILNGDYKNDLNAYFSPFGSDSYFTNHDNFRFGFADERCSTIDDKYVFGHSAAIGYPFYFCDCTMVIAPVIGYAFDEQNIEVNDRGFNFEADSYGFFCEGTDNHGCCENKFISRWYGPFVGVDFDWRPWNSCFNLWAELEYHWGHFRGKRDNCDHEDLWGVYNRRSRHATAWVFAAGLDYDICNNWTVGFSVKFQDWRGNRHHRICSSDAGYLEDSDCCHDNRARNHHKWHSYAINLTLGRDF